MAPVLNEKRFESDIEDYLLTKGGYYRGEQQFYLKGKAVDLSVMVAFISNTQHKEWERYQRTYLGDAEKMLYKRFQEEVESKGLVSVLRKGIKDRGITLRFAYFAPASALNPDLMDKYHQNILMCHRQFAYSQDHHNTVDMVLTLNGIPIAALELKNQFTGQSVEDGKLQFMRNRDPKELIFQFNKRVLVYFVADLTEVWMTTRLNKDKTLFLPFNQGSRGAGEVGGAGNPANPAGYATSYLWEKVLQRDALLAILQRYISVEKGSGSDRKKDKLIFPRYHQLDVVEKLVEDARQNGSGRNYLIQHSAGSGKSNSIAWLCYRLATLHDSEDKELYNSVFVVTDRRVLNRQLQETVLGFEHKDGLVTTITDKNPSADLRDAINDGKKIIITTLHRFPIICEQVEGQKGKRFAVIVDEAHSSQSGTSARKLKETLADTEEALREYAHIEGLEEDAAPDGEDLLVQALIRQGKHGNLSFFGFTATPKPKTLETFGIKQADGQFRAFHIYSMRQAIEEGFIHDVLRYYTTMENSYAVIKSIPENPEMPEPPTVQAIKRYQHGHEDTIARKTEVIVEKFREVTLSKMEGKAKAMVVTASRAHAVKYFQAIKRYIASKGYQDVKPLVAFSGEITIGGEKYTEPMLNSADGRHISESQLPGYFAGDDYNMLVVAEKYQTGFDEPRLHSMFVDKGLKGVKAVQTLSRLNRVATGKVDTYVLDFVNQADDIRKSFLPFYEDTMLKESIDPNMVYTFQDRLDKYCLFNGEDIEKFCEVYLKKGPQTAADMGRLASILKPAVDNYNAMSEDKRFEVRDTVRHFNRAYSYVVQIVRMFDKDLHRYYLFTEYLWRLIPSEAKPIINLSGKITLEKNRLTETFSGSIEIPGGGAVFPPQAVTPPAVKVDKKELLENIIEKINLMYEGKFTEADRVIIETIYDRMAASNKRLAKFAKTNDAEMFTKSIFPEEFSKVAQACYVEQQSSFQKLFQDKSFYDNVMEQMARMMYQGMRNSPRA